MIAYLENDTAIWLLGAQVLSLATGAKLYLNAGASVTFRVQTDAHIDIAGETWPQAMSFIAGPVTVGTVTSPDGNFLGVLRNELVLTEGESYRLVPTIDNGVDQHGTWDIPLRILRRASL